MNRKRALVLRRERALSALPRIDEVMRGSLLERNLRCGKPTCRCTRGELHHAWYLTVSFARGRTEQVTVPPELVSRVRALLLNYQRLWNALEEISDVNRDLLRQRWLDNGDPKHGEKA